MVPNDEAARAGWEEVLKQVNEGTYPLAQLRGVDIDWPDAGPMAGLPTLRFQLEWASDASGIGLWLLRLNGRRRLEVSVESLASLMNTAGSIGIRLNGHSQRLFVAVDAYGVWLSRTIRHGGIPIASDQWQLSGALLDAVSPEPVMDGEHA